MKGKKVTASPITQIVHLNEKATHTAIHAARQTGPASFEDQSLSDVRQNRER